MKTQDVDGSSFGCSFKRFCLLDGLGLLRVVVYARPLDQSLTEDVKITEGTLFGSCATSLLTSS